MFSKQENFMYVLSAVVFILAVMGIISEPQVGLVGHRILLLLVAFFSGFTLMLLAELRGLKMRGQ